MKILPTFDKDTIKQTIQKDFPDIDIRDINLIGDGWDNMVAEINGEYIFRFPKDEDCTFEQELKILDCLQDKTSLLVPKIEYLGRTYSCMGYEKISGNALTREIYESLSSVEKERLAYDLARFLNEFHAAISITKAEEMGLGREDYGSYLDLINKRLKDRIEDPRMSRFVKSTCAEFAATLDRQQNIVVLYDDLHPGNFAFDSINKKLVGIFDFGDVTIGEIHFDFHQLYKFDPELMKAAALRYQELSGIKLELRRMVISARIHELCDLAEFIDQPESRVYKKAIARVEGWMERVDEFCGQ